MVKTKNWQAVRDQGDKIIILKSKNEIKEFFEDISKI